MKKLSQSAAGAFFLVVAGMLPASVSAQAVCSSLWANSGDQQVKRLHQWIVDEGAYHPQTNTYHMNSIATAVLNHVTQNCAAQFRALNMDPAEYVGYVIRLNFRRANDEGVIERVPRDVFEERIRAAGLHLGLRTSQPRVEQPRAAQRQRAAPTPPRHAVIPGCPTCSTVNTH